ncbi:MAG TPA: GNAT family N-acetyltransferase, partial [Allosphingosinicella sp.]
PATRAERGRTTFTETFGHLYSPENLAAFLENHEEERWRAQLLDPTFLVRLAEHHGRAVGYAKLGPPSLPIEVARPAIELRQFYVLKPWQGAGISRELMDWAIGRARATGAEELYLSVFIDNHRARRFYARYGFEIVGRFHFMVGSHADDELILRLDLETSE